MNNVINLKSKQETAAEHGFARLLVNSLTERGVTNFAAFIDGDLAALKGRDAENGKPVDYYLGYFDRVKLEGFAHKKGQWDFLMGHNKTTESYDNGYSGDLNRGDKDEC